MDFLLLIVFLIGSWAIFKKLNNTSNNADDIQLVTIGGLSLEKINNIYYAYIGEQFVGQSPSIDQLIQNMKEIYKVNLFNFDTISELTDDENNQVRQSIEKWYTII